tara:strand:+ start:960 stop:2363 length:1404 start_codon:yes stop_codon:yes gene_type:complete
MDNYDVNNSNSSGSDGDANMGGGIPSIVDGSGDSIINDGNTNTNNQSVLGGSITGGNTTGTVVDTSAELADLILEKVQDLANLTTKTAYIPYAPSYARDTYGPTYYDQRTDGGADANIINSKTLTSKFPVYRIFFKGSTEPTDIMTQSVWSICRHKGIFAGVGNEAGYYQKGSKMTSLHFAGNKHPWNPLILPSNPIRGSGSSQISNGSANMGDNYMPLEHVEAVFHRNVIQGAANISHSGNAYGPEVIKSNAYRVHLKSGATFDLNAGGYTVTSQPTLRMIKPEGNFDTVDKIERSTKPLVYFYSYGGQYYTGDFHNASTFSGSYPANTQSHSYMLRTGLAGAKVGHFAYGSSSYSGLTVDGNEGNYTTNVSDPVKGDPLSLDTGATYLPLENIKAITKLNSGDTGYSLNSTTDLNNSNVLPYQTHVRDSQNNSSPLLNMALGNNDRGYTNVYQPADAGASTLMTE